MLLWCLLFFWEAPEYTCSFFTIHLLGKKNQVLWRVIYLSDALLNLLFSKNEFVNLFFDSNSSGLRCKIEEGCQCLIAPPPPPNEEFGWICWMYIIWRFQITGQSSNLSLNWGKRWQHIHPNEEWMDYWCFPFVKQTKKQTNKNKNHLHVLKNQCDVFW